MAVEVAAASWPALPALPSPATAKVVASGLAAELAYALDGPFHFLLPDAFSANLVAMRQALTRAEVDGFVYYAKKANKAAVFVERAAAGGAGVDVASVPELRESLGHGVRGEHLMVTGPAKDPALLRLAVAHGALVAVDSLDELDRLISLALTEPARPARVLLRVLPGAQPHSRFGMSEGELATALQRCRQAGDRVRMEGFSFHLSGYALRPRADLAARLVDLCLAARRDGLEASRISVGGGLPVSYTDADSWQTFLTTQRPAHYHAGKRFRTDDFYPYHSPVAGAAALRALLATRPHNADSTLADLLREAGIGLALEPGRALLDQAGATVLSVRGVKDREGYQLVTVDGTSLSLSEQWFGSEFLPDPQLIPRERSAAAPAGVFPASVGAATCLESDMLTWRKVSFPHPPRVGDLLLYPNTAGYQMDSNESSFHDLPLPPKVVVDRTDRPRPRWRLDRHFT
ncbi:amino acid decarboxylase [Streptomyces albidoflavus]|uniref:alanine racemase n=1 Tax=Streptomyces albidoflavus TaxID=1886 RepID=UPI00101E27CE|nr:alanine racemase [Streptomyces albidoflavus]RZE08711.1 amino acid decarboxylase [Streptomyces albidoflavus]RZE10722.1 amino acid decarboxylase [Streptomyces albidoflavus]